MARRSKSPLKPPAAASAAPARAVADAGPPLDPRYRLGSWRGRPNYECSACPFKTLDPAEFERHWRSRHAPPPPRPSGLVDSGGTPLTMPASHNEET